MKFSKDQLEMVCDVLKTWNYTCDDFVIVYGVDKADIEVRKFHADGKGMTRIVVHHTCMDEYTYSFMNGEFVLDGVRNVKFVERTDEINKEKRKKEKFNLIF